MSIAIRKVKDIDKLRDANRIVGDTLNLLKDSVKAGVSLIELDEICEKYILSQNAKPSFKGLYGFPSSVCTSVNSVIIHGIPNDYVLKDGDIVGLDVGSELDGWYGDAAITVGVGDVSKENQELMQCSKDTLEYAISQIELGLRFKELSGKIEDFIISKGYIPLKGFCGHGIGRKPHEEPEIPNYTESPNLKQGPKIKNGMVFCLEPMICQKDSKAEILDDKWSVVSADGLNTSHYEHTIAVWNNRVEILSKGGS
jgi:methionyl aminopeptidase